MSKLLIDESPLQVLPSLAVLIGLNEAIALQQIHFRTRDKKDGWCYDSYETWRAEHFPFWSVMTIRRIFKSLIDQDLIFAEKKYNHGKGDHRVSVKINHEGLSNRTALPDQNEQAPDQNEQAPDQNEHIYIHIDSPKTPHRENTPSLSEPSPSLTEYQNQYLKAFRTLPRIAKRDADAFADAKREYGLTEDEAIAYIKTWGEQWRSEPQFWPASLQKFDGALLARLDKIRGISQAEQDEILAEVRRFHPDYKKEIV